MSWRPALSPYARLRNCPVREATLLIVPERIVVLSGEAAAVVGLCDGVRTVPQIIAALGESDGVAEFLDDVREQGWLR
ncbi:MAG TPA: pyrroloquinoline quinone biosynthesis peptide chaperone PqqD [Streptomyces sp.]